MDDTYWTIKRPLEIRVRRTDTPGFDGVSERDALRLGRASADFGLLVRGLHGADLTHLSTVLLTPTGDPAEMPSSQLFKIWISLTSFVARRDIVTLSGEDAEEITKAIRTLSSFLGVLGYRPDLTPLNPLGAASPLSSPDAPPLPSDGEAPLTD